MHSRCRSVAVIFLSIATTLLLLPNELFSATQTSSAAKDPALAALTQMVAATGWTSIPADAIAIGSVTVLSGKNQGTRSFTLKIKGLTESRTELQDATGITATVVNDSEGAVVTPTGSRFLSPYEALSIRPIALPLFSDIADFSSTSVSVAYQEDETINGFVTHKLQISRRPAANDVLFNERFREAPITVWIDAKTGLPAQISYLRFLNNPTASVSFVRQFSNWQAVGTVEIPFQQSEFLDGRLMSTITLTSVQFNVGLSDTDFALPSPAP